MTEPDFGRQIADLLEREATKVLDAKEEYIQEFMRVNNITIQELLRDYELEEQTEWPDFNVNEDTNTYSYTATTYFRLRLKEKTDGGQ